MTKISGHAVGSHHAPMCAQMRLWELSQRCSLVTDIYTKLLNLLSLVPGVRLELTRPILSSPRILSPDYYFPKQFILLVKTILTAELWAHCGITLNSFMRLLNPTHEVLRQFNFPTFARLWGGTFGFHRDKNKEVYISR